MNMVKKMKKVIFKKQVQLVFLQLLVLFERNIYMEKIVVIQIIFFMSCILSGIVSLIFVLRKNDSGLDYNKIIKTNRE